jgi:hypothetical protein
VASIATPAGSFIADVTTPFTSSTNVAPRSGRGPRAPFARERASRSVSIAYLARP